MASEVADKRVAVTPSLLDEIQAWSEITGLKQHEVLTWLIKEAKIQIEVTRPDVIETYNRYREIDTRQFKVAI